MYILQYIFHITLTNFVHYRSIVQVPEQRYDGIGSSCGDATTATIVYAP
jgi:hypothetical protein